MREKEHEDYLAAKDEMDKAVTALEAATATLSEATKDHQEGVLNAMASNLKKVMKASWCFIRGCRIEEKVIRISHHVGPVHCVRYIGPVYHSFRSFTLCDCNFSLQARPGSQQRCELSAQNYLGRCML